MRTFAALALAACLWADPAAAGLVFNFQGVTNSNWGDVATGMKQLSVNVSDAGGGSVAFTFLNSGPNASSITAVYFDDSAQLGAASIVNGTGVSFKQGATPPSLPGGNTIGFQTSFSADTAAPVQPNGVNPGESVSVVFKLINGTTYADILKALHLGADLRIGIKVQGFSSGGSESFVNNPEPASLLLIGLGLVGLALTRRRRLRA